ncbi:MAG: hypothetical protein ACRDM7_06770 [Thermoleophilaceae bacterium]
MRSPLLTVGLIGLAMALAAIPALARPEGSPSHRASLAAAAAAQPDLHRWRLSRHGFGRLKVGLNRTKIERRTGRRLKFVYSTGPCAIWNIGGARGLSVMTIRGRLARVDVSRGTWRTGAGIRVGDSESTVRTRYPRVRTRQHAYDAEGHYLIVPGRKRRVVFETNGDDVVTGFRGGRVPPVMYVEGCA